MTAALAVAVVLACAALVVGRLVRAARAHEAVVTEPLIERRGAAPILHEVCSCGAVRPCGYRERWHTPRLHRSVKSLNN